MTQIPSLLYLYRNIYICMQICEFLRVGSVWYHDIHFIILHYCDLEGIPVQDFFKKESLSLIFLPLNVFISRLRLIVYFNMILIINVFIPQKNIHFFKIVFYHRVRHIRCVIQIWITVGYSDCLIAFIKSMQFKDHYDYR